MQIEGHQKEILPATAETANERFKRLYSNWSYGALISATIVHFAFIQFFPSMTAADIGVVTDEIEAIELPPEVKIPPPPEQIARPATPKVATELIDEDITIAPTTFEDNPVENLPPPPPGSNPEDQPAFIARDVEPRLKNRNEIQRILQRMYPSMLREAGIGGTVILWVFVDEQGEAAKSQVNKSSGYPALDNAAQQVVAKMVFSPALNRDKPVGVWIQQPVTFSVN
ncbi:MAG: energy transducer TonB [Gemmatimonadota bacterium]